MSTQSKPPSVQEFKKMFPGFGTFNFPDVAAANYLDNDPETGVVELRDSTGGLKVVMTAEDYLAIVNAPKVKEPK